MPTLSRRFASVLAIPALILVAACTASTGGATASAPVEPSTTPSQPAASSAAPSTAATTSPSTGGGKGGDYNYGPSSAPPAPASAVPGTGEGIVSVASGAAGPLLTGTNGLTLYTFDNDSTNASACGDGCAESWPPFTVAAGVTPSGGDGVTGTLTTFARADGSMQVAYKGQPLYYYAGDTDPGDTKGDGLGGVWFIATP